ncbi:hypothetical protein GCM10011487_40230 [Steroidobacter agaridevorans]|uniref:Oligosaccharide repeat unit polymerase n=2 Tax=Steroidobacter agaridevorans TaxID=2695856 RepID=A0A829YGI2_9GAMM|nr:hypothetical protein GCM10011487_40230 [Steroidobacter agaridevorans]GFE85588.1 hypothetical protein GCM10011488_05420 [Steroidobacter agaridevorans]
MLYFALLTPLLGIIQVEQGAYAPSVNRWGEPNGATYAFAAYIVFALLGVWISTRGTFFRDSTRREAASVAIPRIEVMKFSTVALIVNGAFCVLTVVVFGGLSVLSGEVGKGEFRTSLGGFGAVAYLILKWLAPTIFALACAMYSAGGKPRGARIPLVVLGLITAIIGASWGFKTTALYILLPGVMVMLWFRPARALLLPAAAAFASIFVAFQMFDKLEGMIYESAFQFILARLTIFQGDVSWFIWDMWRSGEEFANYWITPMVAIGDRLFSMLSGITRDDMQEWVSAHYGSLLTYTIGYPLEGIEEGHSVTGTPFSEGVIAMGAFGIPVFGLLAGIITGWVYAKIDKALSNGRLLSAALWANYSVFFLFGWLNGGEIVTLFHISVIVGAFAAKVLLSMLVALLHAKAPREAALSPAADAGPTNTHVAHTVPPAS